MTRSLLALCIVLFSLKMAIISMSSLQTGKVLQVPRKDMMNQIERAEKKAFSRNETLNFGSGLKKRNTVLTVVFDDATSVIRGGPIVAAYAVFVHPKPGNNVTLHKICVLEPYRRHGVAKQLLTKQILALKRHGCTRILLWVDDQNIPARNLYEKLGFAEVNQVENYYAPGRTGIHMALSLASA